MRLAENFYYDCVLEGKQATERLLMFSRSSVTSITSDAFLNLFLIDSENADAPLYDDAKLAELRALYERQEAEGIFFLDTTTEELKAELRLGDTRRIDLELNKLIARQELHRWLECHANPYYIITDEQFDKICDNLLVE